MSHPLQDGELNDAKTGQFAMRAIQLLIAATIMISPATAFADYVVIAATAAPPAYAPGTEIGTKEVLVLPEGARLTLIERSGRMVTLAGAHRGPVDTTSGGNQDTQGDWSILKRLVGSPDAHSTVLGAARASAGDIPPPPGIWDVSTDSSGPRCVRPGELVLWRRDAGKAATVALRSAQGRHEGLAWPEGAHRMTAPADVARVDGRLLVSIGAHVRDFTLAVMPAELDGAPAGLLLAWLAEKDCRRQALALIERVHAGASLD
jgi:hypothetical protein